MSPTGPHGPLAMDPLGMEEFLGIMRALRQKCPWDRKQTSQSLKPYLIEEAYELLEAIESEDTEAIREELGDLLLQIVFHSVIAEERGEFGMRDVIKGISGKMVSRHPHVFGGASYETAEEVVGQWEERKKEEGKLRDSILDGVPGSMPALLRAQRLQSRASKVGFDWERVEGAMHKVDEELAELKEAVAGESQERVMDELGDVLFSVVNVARLSGVNSEDALRGTMAKFVRRFRRIEKAAEDAGTALGSMTLQEMDALWDKVKAEEAG